jgi:hypothetical protein
MSLLWIEGFENMGSTDNAALAPTGILARKYPTVGGASSMKLQAGRIGGHALELPYATSLTFPGLGTTDATLVVGFALKSTPLVAYRILSLYDDTTEGVNLRLTITGELAVYLGNSLLEATSGLGLTAATWYWIEMKVLCNGSTGTYEIRVGGVNVASDTGVNTKAGSHNYHNSIKLENLTSPSFVHYDDLYILDGGGAVNNDFLGNMKVLSILPDGDSATVQFTPSAAVDHNTLVSENPIDDDTTYVEDTVVGHQDIYDYGTVVGAGSSIAGVQINSCVRETDANSFTLKMPIISGANTSTDAGQAVGTTNYTILHRISETNPNTSNAWTATSLNAAQFGVEVG